MSGRLGRRSTRRTDIPLPHVKNFLEEMDGRTGIVKQLKSRWCALVSDLGGASALSYQERSLAWRLIHVEGWIAVQETRLVRGEVVDENKWLQGINTYAGLMAKLGLSRRPKPTDGLKHLLARPSDPPPDEENDE